VVPFHRQVDAGSPRPPGVDRPPDDERDGTLTLVTGLWLLRAPETRAHESQETRGGRLADLAVPSIAQRRFWRVVVPLAPWVFGCAGSAYAVLPALMSAHAGGLPIAFSALHAVLTLGCGVGIRVLRRAIDTSGWRAHLPSTS